MHLLVAQPGAIDDGSEAVDLGQTPGDILFLSAADTELACLAAAQRSLTEGSWHPPALRLANPMRLAHNLSVDVWTERMVPGARLVVARLLGGRGYWPYGVERIAAVAAQHGVPIALLPGDDRDDADLAAASTVTPAAYGRLWRYCVHGGVDNARALIGYAADLIGRPPPEPPPEPEPLPRAGLYARPMPVPGSRVAAIVFYRALVQAGNTAAVDALIAALEAAGLTPLPVYVSGLKDTASAALLDDLFAAAAPAVILNGTGFAARGPGGEGGSPFDSADCPVLQVVFSGGSRDAWEEGTRGLGPRDIAMNVALPEIDGRILARAVSFKAAPERDLLTECDIPRYEPAPDRIAFTADLAARWARLRATPPGERRLAVILANYPNRDGRIGNGVGLDTPAGTIEALRALEAAGYAVADIPTDGDALVARLLAGPTNQAVTGRTVTETLPLAAYLEAFAQLPEASRRLVCERWGRPEDDPQFLREQTAFAVPAFRLGRIAVGLQPARGYGIDPEKSYHDPDLPPPHGYLAFYVWLREAFGADAVVHMGKHGNLEWLPGKAIALSAACFPEAALGAMPHVYPFIVNDPGEGSQAKRRAQAVIIDHLTPPLTRAESYGPLRELERLVDEYYEAAGLDPRRLEVLGREIVSLAATSGIDADCGIGNDDEEATALAKLDAFLCELKEMQIRDGLHIFGRSPTGEQRTGLLAALVRHPRGSGAEDASLTRALAGDLGLELDPLTAEPASPWTGPRPAVLERLAGDPWRSAGDTIERLEWLAHGLVAGTAAADPSWERTHAVLGAVSGRLAPAVDICGERELAGLLAALDGRFVEPGPSGAPTRGRPDVLPTGRNFFSVDTRTVPTPAAWTLGWRSATLLVERYVQDHGEWPRRLLVSAWGTSNMRTGGDDISQALALMGVSPTWDAASRRLTGFEVMPLSVLDRPRVDVTLRISGFFRDAFPALIDLFDSAVRTVAALDEPEDSNPVAAAARAEGSTARIFGAKPGAYGAGLQALIDEGGWSDIGDLAQAYVAWGGWAYGAGREGAAAQEAFSRRLAATQAVVHNQDNREHDLLDSDDYYQFEGGAAAAVAHLSGRRAAIYHNDHSLPERPRIRALEEEIARVVRARAANPKWIAGVMRHGWKGVFEIAATVDYLFAFAATTGAVKDHHFDLVFEAYFGDEAVLDFMRRHNPAAMREAAARLIEAQERALWRPRTNMGYQMLERIAGSTP